MNGGRITDVERASPQRGFREVAERWAEGQPLAARESVRVTS